MANRSPHEPSTTTTDPQQYGPVHRLEEALKQIGIANEDAEGDVGDELRAAAKALRSARAKLAEAD